MAWTKTQKSVALAAYLGWTLDAFDFFLMVFMFSFIDKDFGVEREEVVFAVTLTLIARPIGAFVFGRLADKYGRRPTLMWNILAFSILEFASGWSPNLQVLLVLRFLFGVAMGGEWGVGSSLTMETVPTKSRGIVSGMLQAGYPSGFLLASFVFRFYDSIGWRGMFMVGVLPALLIFFVRFNVPESPGWKAAAAKNLERPSFVATLSQNWKLAVYAIILMTAFNFFSHGTQDAYPNLFLTVQHKLDPKTVSNITIVSNIGAICGGLLFGWLSERIGRRRGIAIAALLALPFIYIWAFSETAVMLAAGAFLIQISVQGAWGIIPVHLNELSPGAIRGTFPGTVYQLGNLIASVNLPMQVGIAKAYFDGQIGNSMAIVAGVVAVVIAILVMLGPEHRGENLGADTPVPTT
jgi:SHS family lactate transporter-like MFS transporter